MADRCSDRLKHRELTDKIIGSFFDVYNELGHGLLEAVYEGALSIALMEQGLIVDRQVAIPVYFRDRLVGEYRADMLVNKAVLLELKVARTFAPSHSSQLVHYLRTTDIEIGLLLNFGSKPMFKRFFVRNDSKKIRFNLSKSVVGGSVPCA
jgi:GxxExxY protein